jgi:hypothetical protein
VAMKKRYILFFLTGFFICVQTNAQDLNFNEEIRKLIESNGKASVTPAGGDTTLRTGQPDELEDMFDQDTIRTNPPDESENRIEQDTIPVVHQTPPVIYYPPLSMSPEALFWSRYAYSYNTFGPNVTFRDTIIVNPLFMPVLFREGYVMPDEGISLYQPKNLTEENWRKPLYAPVKIFEKQILKSKIEDMAYRYIQRYCPEYFHHNAQYLPKERTHYIRKEKTVEVSVEKKGVNPMEYTTPTKFIPDRKYWTSSFESAIKFSQNYVSPNWHKGGVSNLNIFTKNQLQYNYEKGPIQYKHLLDINASAYSAPKDTLREYKLGDDLLRFYANFGYKAFSKWYYTIGTEFKTQMFTNYQENTMLKQAALLSPYTWNLELGMKYDLVKAYKQRKDRSLSVAINIAPLSYTYMYSITDDIDLGRHGFQKNELTDAFENSLSKFGSTLRADMSLKPNRNVTWKSRLYYFTSYDRMVGEFENSLDMAISRYFSTLIYLHIRYDDGVTKNEEFDSFFQANEILSFGFSYKW